MPATVDRRGFLKSLALGLGALTLGLKDALDGLRKSALGGFFGAEAERPGAAQAPKIEPPRHSVSRRS